MHGLEAVYRDPTAVPVSGDGLLPTRGYYTTLPVSSRRARQGANYGNAGLVRDNISFHKPDGIGATKIVNDTMGGNPQHRAVD